MYTKLANSILTSTIWMESDQTRIVWLTLLAMCDKNGEVQASVPGLANVARVTIEDCEAAIELFMSPDPYSRTKTDEGRRIEEIDGGWSILNHEKYRDLASDSDAKRKAADRQRRFRERQKRNGIIVTSNAESVTACDKSRSIPHTDTDTDTDTDTEANTKKPKHNVANAPVRGFQKPTVQEVIDYVTEIQVPVDAKEFVDYYTSNGWKIGGKASMKDWKATVRQWAARRRKEAAETANVSRYSDDFVETLKICKQHPGREAYQVREQKLGSHRTYAVKKSGGSSALIEASLNDQNLRNFAAVFEIHLKEALNGITASN